VGDEGDEREYREHHLDARPEQQATVGSGRGTPRVSRLNRSIATLPAAATPTATVPASTAPGSR
jgi:hypothetical protein